MHLNPLEGSILGPKLGSNLPVLEADLPIFENQGIERKLAVNITKAIGSSAGLVPTNALVLTDLANFRV